MSDENAGRGTRPGRARIGRWSLPWHPAWWLTTAFLGVAVAVFTVRVVATCDNDQCDLVPRDFGTTPTILISLALASYFWAYGHWRRRHDVEAVSSDAQQWLVLLLGVLLALALWPLGGSEDWTCTPISTLFPFGDDMPEGCKDELGVRTVQIALLGLFAIPLAISTAVDRAHERLFLDGSGYERQRNGQWR